MGTNTNRSFLKPGAKSPFASCQRGSTILDLALKFSYVNPQWSTTTTYRCAARSQLHRQRASQARISVVPPGKKGVECLQSSH